MSRSIRYTASPLLTSRTPVWRSKLVVSALALGFVGVACGVGVAQAVAGLGGAHAGADEDGRAGHGRPRSLRSVGVRGSADRAV